MPTAVTPTTLLEAVNIILDGIGEAPTNTLVSTNEDVSKALDRIDEASRDIQGAGYWFNTEDKTFPPTAEGEYALSPEILSAITVNYRDRAFIQRGRRMYDRENNRFDGNTDDLDLRVIVLLDFEDLPEEARRAIFVQAARKFGDRVIGSTVLHQLLAMDEGNSFARLVARHLESERWNSLESPTTYRAVDRRRI